MTVPIVAAVAWLVAVYVSDPDRKARRRARRAATDAARTRAARNAPPS